ncbi:MAG: hypothetical protein KJ573_13550, partial [Proteobacteria bacterium]|nr:hypothetical protein [Pseudomonadota bacterium]
MAVFYTLHLRAPFLTGVKVLLGCVSFGLFGGMLSFLSMEKKIIEFLRERKIDITVSPKTLFSVSKKMLLLVLTVLGFMVVAILLMVFMDIQYLLSHEGFPGPDIYFGIFKEVLFAFTVLLVLSLLILGRYSQNLRAVLARQLRVMEDISQGKYDTRVPVVSNDEFGLIAAKTNQMISGLRDRDFCQISFGRYVTPEVSEKVLKGEIPLEGEMRDVTILFCDLRGYTTFVEMRKRLKELNIKRETLGEKPVDHGIGIHTGTVLA